MEQCSAPRTRCSMTEQLLGLLRWPNCSQIFVGGTADLRWQVGVTTLVDDKSRPLLCPVRYGLAFAYDAYVNLLSTPH